MKSRPLTLVLALVSVGAALALGGWLILHNLACQAPIPVQSDSYCGRYPVTIEQGANCAGGFPNIPIDEFCPADDWVPYGIGTLLILLAGLSAFVLYAKPWLLRTRAGNTRGVFAYRLILGIAILGALGGWVAACIFGLPVWPVYAPDSSELGSARGALSIPVASWFMGAAAALTVLSLLVLRKPLPGRGNAKV